MSGIERDKETLGRQKIGINIMSERVSGRERDAESVQLRDSGRKKGNKKYKLSLKEVREVSKG